MKTTIVLCLALFTLARAASAVDPQCVGQDGRNQPPSADYSDGTIDLCIDQRNANGNLMPVTETVTCDLSIDGTLYPAVAVGNPGTYHAIPVPPGVYGAVTVEPGPCRDSAGNQGVAGTPVPASFPAAPVPTVPGPRPPSLLP